MKASDHETPWTCICKAGKPIHGNLPLVNISLRSRKREEPFSALLTFPQQSANFLSKDNLITTTNWQQLSIPIHIILLLVNNREISSYFKFNIA